MSFTPPIPVPGAPALALTDVGASYGERQVLRGVSLEVAPGHVHGLIGPNGAGKSTLLRAALGLVPTTGIVEVHGHPLQELKPRGRAHLMSYLAQDTTTDTDFTGHAYVQLGRYARTTRFGSMTADDEDAVDEALRLTGAIGWRHRQMRQTSGGERQLTALARAIAQNPSVLMLDEPTSALDMGHSLDILRLLRPWIDVAPEERTVVIVMHDLNLAARFCDVLTLIDDGTIKSHGSPAEVLTRANLRDAYDVDTDISRNPVTGTVLVTPL